MTNLCVYCGTMCLQIKSSILVVDDNWGVLRLTAPNVNWHLVESLKICDQATSGYDVYQRSHIKRHHI